MFPPQLPQGLQWCTHVYLVDAFDVLLKTYYQRLYIPSFLGLLYQSLHSISHSVPSHALIHTPLLFV